MRGKLVVVLMLSFGLGALALALIFLRAKPGEKLGISATDRALGPALYWTEARLHLIGRDRTLHLAGDGRAARQLARVLGPATGGEAVASDRVTFALDPARARAAFGALVAADVVATKPSGAGGWRLVLVNSSREVREVGLPEPLPEALKAALAPVLELGGVAGVGTATVAPAFDPGWRPF